MANNTKLHQGAAPPPYQGTPVSLICAMANPCMFPVGNRLHVGRVGLSAQRPSARVRAGERSQKKNKQTNNYNVSIH